MKKTIIASAVAAAVAAPAAFADVKISGMVNPEYGFSDASTGNTASVNTDLVFSGSEDLGNGLKVTLKYHMTNDDGASASGDAAGTNGTASTPATGGGTANTPGTVATHGSHANMTVGLSGDFGSLEFGRMEGINQSYFHAVDLDPAHDINLEDANGQQSRANGGVLYTSPSINGLTLMAGISQGAGVVAGTDTTDVELKEIAAKYSNGGLLVAVGHTTHASDNGTDDEEVTNVRVDYKMGDFMFRVQDRQVDNDGGVNSADSDNTYFGVKYTMGNNAFTYGVIDADDAEDGDSVFSAEHNMSKSTKVYIAHFNDDSSSTTDNTIVGIKHAF
jgi:predicted porin